MTKKTSEHPGSDGTMTFWDHLDVLRGDLIRIALAVVICGIAAFLFKDEVFSVILAPKDGDFILYRLFDGIKALLFPSVSSTSATGSGSSAHSITLINTGLASQFVIHLRVSFYVGILVSFPYILYRLFGFISPALYENERKYGANVVVWGYFMFLLGVLLSYFLIFPLTVRFLGTYQISGEVANMIDLQSYIGTMVMMCMLMGILFELPVISWLLGKLGVLKADFMARFRKHVIVLILVVAAAITPTTDAFTLFLVALPIWLLYELSIAIVRRTAKA